MVNFAGLIHRKYKKGCLEIFNSAIKLMMPCEDMIYVLYCYNKSFKSPFLDQQEFSEYIKNRKFGDIMEELLVARDIINKNIDKDTTQLEQKIAQWNKDIQR